MTEITQTIDPGYGIDATLSLDPATGNVKASTYTIGDGTQPTTIEFDPQTPIGAALDAIAAARAKIGV